MEHLSKHFYRDEDGYFFINFDRHTLVSIKSVLRLLSEGDTKVGTMRFACATLDAECDGLLDVVLQLNMVESLEFSPGTYTANTLVRVSNALRTNTTLLNLCIEDTQSFIHKENVRKHFVETLRTNRQRPADSCWFVFIDPRTDVDDTTPNDLSELMRQARALGFH